MANQISEYKCPSCTGPLRFDAATGKLTCDYCGSSYPVEEIEALYAKKDEEAVNAESKYTEEEKSARFGESAQNLMVYSCPSCGAELITDPTTAATSCPYCGNNTIIPSQYTEEFAPDYVIPFKVTKEQAIAGLQNHYKGKKLLPKVFTQKNHIEEIKGVYVPFWLYNAHADASMVFEGETVSSVTTKNEIIETHTDYELVREGSVEFDKIPVDGSKKMPDDYMDSIEPFDYSDLKPYSNAYLPGFLADKYDVSEEECKVRSDKRCRESVDNLFRQSCSMYSGVLRRSGNIDVKMGKAKLALLPVWLLSTKYDNQNYLFAMNGQTGKMVGDLPISKSAYWKEFGKAFAITTAIGAALAAVLMGMV